MSVSTLETLPNEILIDIIEKYINGIDIINAFAFQLNQRFDALIIRSQKLRLDFKRCHKNHFRVCMGLLPAYSDKIEQLTLSEENTPGQIHAFFSFFPSFDIFKRLRKIYLHINYEIVVSTAIVTAVRSLLTISLHTLYIEIANRQTPVVNFLFGQLFRIKTLKKFSIICNCDEIDWTLLDKSSSNIEYLTMYNIPCGFQDLKHILRWAPRLKYLEIQIQDVNHYNNSERKLYSEDSIPQMSMLHTVLFKISKYHHTTILNELEPYLRCMPSLRCLEIKMRSKLNDVNAWETLLRTSVPNLTHFNLESFVFYSINFDINDTLKHFQTPFWTQNNKFNIIIKIFSLMLEDPFALHNNETDLYGSKNPVRQCWVASPCNANDNFFATNKISSLSLSTECAFFLQNYYFNNINHLILENFDDNLFKLLTTHINCSRIKHFDVTLLKQTNNRISSFLSYIRNITSLRIRFNQLFDKQFTYLRECNHLKFLDISTDQHRFDKKYISIIKEIFPNVEHLIINTQDLQNVPLLQTYLPHLHSLTFVHDEPIDETSRDRYKEQRINNILRQKARFLFHRVSNKITVWLDQDTLQDSFWINTNRSSHDSWFKTLSNRVSSMFN